MSENPFDDIGFDLVEKIAPPTLPVKNIIESSSPSPLSELPTASPGGNKKGWNTLWIILGLAAVGFVGYKIWQWKKEEKGKKRGY